MSHPEVPKWNPFHHTMQYLREQAQTCSDPAKMTFAMTDNVIIIHSHSILSETVNHPFELVDRRTDGQTDGRTDKPRPKPPSAGKKLILEMCESF